MKKPAVKHKTAAEVRTEDRRRREDKIKRLARELEAARKSPASGAVTAKKTVKKVKAAKKPRAWSPDEVVACCSARAVAEALRLCSGPVLSDADVVSLHWAAGGDRDGGASILDVLRAAQERVPGFPVCSPWPADRRIDGGGFGGFASASHCGVTPSPGDLSVILGLDLPWGKPHAVTVDSDGTWWSWGQPYNAADFPGAVIEEAWTVTW